jgi:SAM-dependent methyltransferase
MPVREKLVRFARKPLPEKRDALKATLRGILGTDAHAAERRRLRALLTGPHAPPAVLQGHEKFYIAYRPDSDLFFSHYPEIRQLSEKWTKNNTGNNAGDLPRLYALMMNVRQVLTENVVGDIAELGVFQGNSAAVLAHYARIYGRQLLLFDTFGGFDRRDLVGRDGSRQAEFASTSLAYVREFVGDDNVHYVRGWFPESIPPDLYASRFCLVHIDCDLYKPMKAGLEFFYERLSPGGLLIIHDYVNPFWEGIKRAVDEFCGRIPERPVVFGDKSGTAMIRKSIVK